MCLKLLSRSLGDVDREGLINDLEICIRDIKQSPWGYICPGARKERRQVVRDAMQNP